MLHSEFVDKFRRHQITVRVDKNKAGFMYQSPSLLPDKIRRKQALIRTFAFGGVLIGAIGFFFMPWWAALAVLFFGFYLFPRAQQQAAEGVLAAALDDPQVYELAVANDMFIISDRAS